jgi:hypothetical protein
MRACAVLMVLAATKASGGGINLAWNDCYGAGGTVNKNFACNTNSGTNILVASFEPPDGITKLVGSSAVIDIQTASTPLPSWWQLSASGCRAGSLRLDFNPPASQSCADYWSAAATGSLAYLPGFGGHPDRARITISFGIPEARAGPVLIGWEYYAFRLILDNSKSSGAGACSGCLDPACITLTSVWLYQPEGLGDHAICVPLASNQATWRGGAIGGYGCPGTDGPPPPPSDCLATPTINRTWGQLKGLYR